MRKVATLLVVVLLVSQAVLLAASRTLPTPESVLGFKPGADNKLATYDQAIGYLRKLAAASSSIRLVEAGKTTNGRVMYFALISNPKNLDKIDRYREIAQRLAHPQGLSDDEARRLAREGKAFVHLDGGCHATEVAGVQMTLQLAYDLLNRAAEPAIKEILDNDILMLWPTMNPDGQQMVGEWLAKNAGTPFEQSGLPRLYQEYVGHDNNRDAYMLNMIESRVMEHFWRQWEPNMGQDVARHQRHADRSELDHLGPQVVFGVVAYDPREHVAITYHREDPDTSRERVDWLTTDPVRFPISAHPQSPFGSFHGSTKPPPPLPAAATDR